MYGLRLLLLFYKNYIVYQIVYMLVWSELEVAITSPSFVTVYLMVSEIVKYIAWGCFLLFYKNYIVYRIVYMFVWSQLLFAITSPSFVTLHLPVSEIAICIAWGYLLLFYKNYIVYYNVYCNNCSVFTEKYAYTEFRLDWLLYVWVTWPFMSLS